MRFVFGVLVLLAVSAFATRPDARSLDEMIVGELQVEASNLGVTAEDDLISGIAKLGCSLSPTDCARLIRSAMTIEVRDVYLARLATVTFGEDPALDCVGVFTQWTCRPAG